MVLSIEAYVHAANFCTYIISNDVLGSPTCTVAAPCLAGPPPPRLGSGGRRNRPLHRLPPNLNSEIRNTRDVGVSDLHWVPGKGKEQDRWIPAAVLPRRPRPSSGWVGGFLKSQFCISNSWCKVACSQRNATITPPPPHCCCPALGCRAHL
jgi:hypothetical protein